MSYFLYSAEDFPAKRKKNVAFQDNPEFLRFNNFNIGPVKAGEWKELDRRQQRTEFQDFSDRRGSRVVTLDEEFAEAFNARFADTADTDDAGRGLIVLDDKSYNDSEQRTAAEEKCQKQNRAFRLRRIAEFEMQLQERTVTGKGRAYPTPYEEECYVLTGTVRPNSAEAIEAQRNPGKAVAAELATAIMEASQAANQRLREPISDAEAAAINAKLDEDKKDPATAQAVVFAGDPNQS